MMWTNNGLRDQILNRGFDNLNLAQWQDMKVKIVGGDEPDTVTDAKEEVLEKLVELKKSGHGRQAAKWQKPSARMDDVIAAINAQKLAIDEQLVDMRQMTEEQLEAMQAATRAIDPVKLAEEMRRLVAATPPATTTPPVTPPATTTPPVTPPAAPPPAPTPTPSLWQRITTPRH